MKSGNRFCIYDMVRNKKKFMIFLITAVMGCCVLLVYSARSAAVETESPNSESKSNSLFKNDSSLFSNTNNGPGTKELFFKFLVSVLFLIALAVGGIYISKRFLPKISNMSGREIKIVETIHLGPRKAVHLLEIGERRFLIGSTNENITKLADLTGVLTEL